MKKVAVNLKDQSYQISIKSSLINEFEEHVDKILKAGDICIITDENVAELYLENLKKALSKISNNLHQIILPAGEEQKCQSTVSMIYDTMLERGFGRDGAIIAFGGGVIGDITGFVAATYMRGIDHIQIPTTLLAQVDSSVGGKTGINHRLGKNLIGSFYQPKGVFIDPKLLKTLSKRDLNSGLIEVIKHSIIRDPDLFEFINQNLDAILGLSPEFIENIIEKNCNIKASIVSEDEREKGIRIVLNLGHTAGHAIERLTGFDELRHGEAVGLGIMLESFISNKAGYLSGEDYERITDLILRVIPRSLFPQISAEALIESMDFDKKKQKGKLRFVLPKVIGDTFVSDEITNEQIKEAVDAMSNLKESQTTP